MRKAEPDVDNFGVTAGVVATNPAGPREGKSQSLRIAIHNHRAGKEQADTEFSIMINQYACHLGWATADIW